MIVPFFLIGVLGEGIVCGRLQRFRTVLLRCIWGLHPMLSSLGQRASHHQHPALGMLSPLRRAVRSSERKANRSTCDLKSDVDHSSSAERCFQSLRGDGVASKTRNVMDAQLLLVGQITRVTLMMPSRHCLASRSALTSLAEVSHFA